MRDAGVFIVKQRRQVCDFVCYACCAPCRAIVMYETQPAAVCQRRRSLGALRYCCHARHCSSATNRHWRAQTVSPKRHAWHLMRHAFLMHSFARSHLARGPRTSMTNFNQVCHAVWHGYDLRLRCALRECNFRRVKFETSMLHGCVVRVCCSRSMRRVVE